MTRPVVLITERDDLAADLIVLEMNRRGSPFVRINLEDYPEKISISLAPSERRVQFRTPQGEFEASDFRSAWFRRMPELVNTSSREPWVEDFVHRERMTFLNALWSFPAWTWMNHPEGIAATERKPVQLRTALESGFRVPRTLVTNDYAQALSFVSEMPAVAKVVSVAGIDKEGERLVAFTRSVTVEDLDPAALVSSPVILQERIWPKMDIRVTVVGQRVFATEICLAEHTDDVLDWREAADSNLEYSPFDLPDVVTSACRRMRGHSGLNFAAFDLARNQDGDYFFLELNPSGQWGWIERKTGQQITRAIVDTLCAEA